MYYFAYGSNLSKKQMSERCPDSKPMFIATLPNHQMVFAGWSRKWRGGVASLKTFRGAKVPGAIYEVTEPLPPLHPALEQRGRHLLV